LGSNGVPPDVLPWLAPHLFTRGVPPRWSLMLFRKGNPKGDPSGSVTKGFPSGCPQNLSTNGCTQMLPQGPLSGSPDMAQQAGSTNGVQAILAEKGFHRCCPPGGLPRQMSPRGVPRGVRWRGPAGRNPSCSKWFPRGSLSGVPLGIRPVVQQGVPEGWSPRVSLEVGTANFPKGVHQGCLPWGVRKCFPQGGSPGASPVVVFQRVPNGHTGGFPHGSPIVPHGGPPARSPSGVSQVWIPSRGSPKGVSKHGPRVVSRRDSP
jgi:hypothetical protein